MTIPYKWLCSFTIDKINIPANKTIDGIEFESLPSGEKWKRTGKFIVELNDLESPDKEQIEQKVNLLAAALTAQYSIGEINILEPKLLNEEELRSAGQRLLVALELKSKFDIEPPIVETDKIENVILNLNKPNVRRDSYLTALRWMRKAALDNDNYDRFIAYWIAFNALYGKPCNSEQQSIEKFIKDEFEYSECQDLLEKGISDMTIATLYNSGLKLRSQDVTGDLKTQYELIKRKDPKSDFLTCLTKLVLSIYAVRNNTFHGDFMHGQRDELITASTLILTKLLKDYFTKKLYIV
jgi:hypothetical protein